MQPEDCASTLVVARRAEELAIQRRLVALVAAGRTTDMAAAPLRIPASVYADPLRLDAEIREIFLQQPQVAGLSCDIPNPGDVSVFDSAGPSILLTRKADGSAAAFLNMCTHRGARLKREPGHCEAITCPFHGWSFGLDGRLAAQPGKAGFAGMESHNLDLLAVPCAERHGLIFVLAQAGTAALDLDAHLGSLAPELEQLQFDTLTLIRQGRLHTKGNWKYVLDTYGEGYHFAALHPDTLGRTHYSNVATYDAYGAHFRVSFPQKLYGKLKDLPEAQWPGIDSVVYVLFPNTAIVVGSPQPGLMVVQVFRIFPDGVDRTRVELALYAPAAAVSDATRPIFMAGFDLAANIVQNEDYLIAAEAFDNLKWAPPDFHTVLGRNEPALQDLQRNIAAACGMPWKA